MLAVVFVISILLYVLAYRYYGRFLDRHFGIDDNGETPSHTDYDGVDKVPAKTARCCFLKYQRLFMMNFNIVILIVWKFKRYMN